MKKAILKARVLRMIGARRTYAYAIVKEIEGSPHAARFFRGRNEIKDEVYNTIKVLEKSGYIRLANEKSGPARSAKQPKSDRLTNYYTITKEGKSVLNGAKKILVSSIKEISDMFK
jgi:DNA-binding PadR family transcriptional regulator